MPPAFPVISDTALEAAELLLRTLYVLNSQESLASGSADRPWGHAKQALRVLLRESLGTELADQVWDVAMDTAESITWSLGHVLETNAAAEAAAREEQL